MPTTGDTATQRRLNLEEDRKARSSDHPLRKRAGKYLPDFILGATDGIITTLAIISGVVGADLSASVILILGFANLVADGISMAASNVLSRRSSPDDVTLPTLLVSSRHGATTFFGFVLAGLVPLLAYLLPDYGADRFVSAVALALLTLFAVGSGRAFFTSRGWLLAGLEMLGIGALAAGAAYGIGALGAYVMGGI
jgi:VIT1/CCC1 family predicted Fe2+/Mn2+ transporter